MPRRPSFPSATEAEIKAEVRQRRVEAAKRPDQQSALVDDHLLERWLAEDSSIEEASRTKLPLPQNTHPRKSWRALKAEMRRPGGSPAYCGPVTQTDNAIDREAARLQRLALRAKWLVWCDKNNTDTRSDNFRAYFERERTADISAATSDLTNIHLTTDFLHYCVELAGDAGANAIAYGDGTRGPVTSVDDLRRFIDQEVDRGAKTVAGFYKWKGPEFPAAGEPDMARRGIKRALEIIDSGAFDAASEIYRTYQLALDEIVTCDVSVTAITSFHRRDRVVLAGEVLMVPASDARSMCKGVNAVARRSAGF